MYYSQQSESSDFVAHKYDMLLSIPVSHSPELGLTITIQIYTASVNCRSHILMFATQFCFTCNEAYCWPNNEEVFVWCISSIRCFDTVFFKSINRSCHANFEQLATIQFGRQALCGSISDEHIVFSNGINYRNIIFDARAKSSQQNFHRAKASKIARRQPGDQFAKEPKSQQLLQLDTKQVPCVQPAARKVFASIQNLTQCTQLFD